jgi:hypothetical protein
MEPYAFSEDLNAYLKKVLKDHDRTDLSGRWLDALTNGARSYDYWSKIVKNTRAMTTNDIQVLAEAFDVTPYAWVQSAREYAASHLAPVTHLNVGTHAEDYGTGEDPGDKYPNAAEEPRKPGD